MLDGDLCDCLGPPLLSSTVFNRVLDQCYQCAVTINSAKHSGIHVWATESVQMVLRLFYLLTRSQEPRLWPF